MDTSNGIALREALHHEAVLNDLVGELRGLVFVLRDEIEAARDVRTEFLRTVYESAMHEQLAEMDARKQRKTQRKQQGGFQDVVTR